MRGGLVGTVIPSRRAPRIVSRPLDRDVRQPLCKSSQAPENIQIVVRMTVRATLGLLVISVVTMVGACTLPPPETYLGGAARRDGTQLDLGTNSAGEPCSLLTGPTVAQIHCGTYVEPAGYVNRFPADVDVRGVLTDSQWRQAMDNRFRCDAPVPIQALELSGYAMACTRRQGGWPHAVLAVRIDGNAFVADGIQAAESILPLAIGVVSGRRPGVRITTTDTSGLETERRAMQADKINGAGAIAEVEFQLARGGMENRRGNYAAAESAYRAVVLLQERLIGRHSPALAVPLARQALQVSNQGRFIEADQLFLRADGLTRGPDQIDPAARPMVAYLRALHQLNLGQNSQALTLLDQAEAGFVPIVPREFLAARAQEGQVARSGVERMADAAADAAVLANLSVATAFNGLTEARRYRAVALSALGRTTEAESALASVRALYVGRDPRLAARYLRTTGMTVAATGRPGRAAVELGAAATAFARSQPLSLPLAETLLLQAGELVQAGKPDSAVPLCQEAAHVLGSLRSGLPSNRFVACLRAFDAAGGPTRAADMFALSQFAQGTVTSRHIARATARLAEATRDPAVAEAMRARDRADQALDALYQRRAERGAERTTETDAAAMADQIAKAREALREADIAVQAASPRFSGLVQEAVSVDAVRSVLGPHEAVAAIVPGDSDGWVFLIRRDAVMVGTIRGGAEKIDPLVRRIRASVEPGPENRPKPYDTEAAHALYTAVLGPVAEGLNGLSQLTVAVSGTLVSIPFSLLLTEPHADPELGRAPFLIRRLAVSHVPSAGGFVNLRRSAKVVRAGQPWFGLGDLRPPSVRQAAATFPPGACGDNARLFASLGPLPGARRELEAARQILNAKPTDVLMGADFTAQRVRTARLSDYRVLHFATHALLPHELRCQSEPAVLTSVPPDAPNASAALLTASQIEQMTLDAELVILAACNTGGGDGVGAGESLSGLARSFFFAGARSLLVTHWDANDLTTTYLTALFLAGVAENPRGGVALALARAQRRMLDEATGERSVQSHPSYWAVGALIGGGAPDMDLPRSVADGRGIGSAKPL